MIEGFLSALSPSAFLWTLLGTAAGVVVGAIPGLGGGMLMVLALPLTFAMDPIPALLMLIGIHVGSVSGGMISATLLRMPGTPSSLMTTFDGHPMAESGRARRALALGIGSSLVGGIVSWLVLVTLAPPLARWALTIGPWEIAALLFVALVLVAAISRGSMLFGLFSAILGILAATPGISESDGQLRLTFGVEQMSTGFRLLPVLLGIFVISQLFKEVESVNRKKELLAIGSGSDDPRAGEWWANKLNLLRSSLIGTFVGILPGAGASISSMVSYAVARSSSRTPERFGTGSDEGVVASEAANNANVGGAMVPLVTLGIPGAPVDAILLGAMVMQGLQPGPLLFQSNSALVWALMAGYLIANFLMFAIMWGTYRQLAKIVTVPAHYLVPLVFVACTIGSFSVGNRLFDVWVMLAFGVLGYCLDKARVPLGPFVIGFVLATPFETELRAALQLSDGSVLALFQHPIAVVLVVIGVLMLGGQKLKGWIRSGFASSRKSGAA